MENIPLSINQTLAKTDKSIDDVNYFVFHKTNNYMLKALSRRIELDQKKVIIDIEN